MDIRRVVQVWARGTAGSDRVGSGHLLTDSLVLTAAHVLGPLLADRDDAVLGLDEVVVQSHWGAGRTVPVSRAVRLGDDIALLQCGRRFTHTLGPAPVLGATGSSAVVLPAVVVGYPDLGLQRPPLDDPTSPDQDGERIEAAASYRRDTQFDGEVSTGTGFGDGTITVHLHSRHLPAPDGARRQESAFAGLSGAAIFVGGHLIGVTTQDPSPDHPTLLVGHRVDRVVQDARSRTSVWSEIQAWTGGALDRPPVDVSVTAGSRAVRDAHLWQARTILDNIEGGALLERGRELAEMARFCADPHARYLVWHADEWSGKSALLATFVAEPPGGVDIVAFFVSRNDADARTADRYLASLTAQLQAYQDSTGEPASLAAPGAAVGRYRDLLTRAAQVAADDGRRLVLVVDALDEDHAFTAHSDAATSIAALLPANVPGLHVIVTTRPYEHVLTATRAHHPFRATTPTRLDASQHAADIRDEAASQVRAAATGADSVARSILAFLLAAGAAALTPAELADMMSRPDGGDPVTTAAVRTRLHTVLHRTVRRRIRITGDLEPEAAARGAERYEWAHDTLPAIVTHHLGAALIDDHARTLHLWAETDRARGWTDATPGYLETGYPALLADTGRAATLAEYALDRARHEWLLDRRGGNDQALNEITQAAQLLTDTAPRDYRHPRPARIRTRPGARPLGVSPDRTPSRVGPPWQYPPRRSARPQHAHPVPTHPARRGRAGSCRGRERRRGRAGRRRHHRRLRAGGGVDRCGAGARRGRERRRGRAGRWQGRAGRRHRHRRLPAGVGVD